MAEPFKPIPIPRSFMADMPAATVNLGLTLMSRRSSALADFWRSCAESRQPTDLMAAQLDYWTQLVDDYQEVINEGLSQISAGPAADDAGPAPPAS